MSSINLRQRRILISGRQFTPLTAPSRSRLCKILLVQLSEFDYHLPSELIAQQPSHRRDESRLMVVDRRRRSWEHHLFKDLPGLLSPNDLLVLNESRVIPARLYAAPPQGGRKIEVLLLQQLEEDVWEALLKPGRKARLGARLIFQAGHFEAVVLEPGHSDSAVRRLRFEYSGNFWEWLQKMGQIPLPPYIQRLPERDDWTRYQTVFARVPGSVAAPTAGLHFTPGLLEKVPHCTITLHVGYGTFKPISADRVEEHRMEAERYEIEAGTAERVNEMLEKRNRVIAVGTTTTRVLESVFLKQRGVRPGHGWTDLFIFPGFEFKVIGGLITNFHLPKSTLLLLVSAFAGKELMRAAYEEAIRQKYRFYSYGDAMLII